MGQRSVPAPFLTKTYQLVDDPATDDVISWGQDGNSFVVWKTADFARDLLPTYFKHSNFSSFIRQLNTYGFRKVVADKWEFANDNFTKGEAGRLSKIRRRKAISLSKKQMQKPVPININPYCPESMTGGGVVGEGDDDMGSTSTSSSSPVTGKQENSIKVMAPAAAAVPANESNNSKQRQQQEVDNILSYENERLKRDNEILSSELDLAKKQCDGLIAFLTKHLKVGSDQINSILTHDGTGALIGRNYTANNLAAGGDHEDKSCLENEHDDYVEKDKVNIHRKKKKKKEKMMNEHDDYDEKDKENIHRKKKKKKEKMMINGTTDEEEEQQQQNEKEKEKGNVEGLRLFGFFLKKGGGGGGPCCMEIADQQGGRNQHSKGYSWLSEESM